MTEFKVGDIVKQKESMWKGLNQILNNSNPMTIKAVLYNNTQYPGVKFEEIYGIWDAAFFELAEEEKVKNRFAVGDKVVSIKDTPQAPEGFIGYVTLILSGQYGIHVTKEGEYGAKSFDEDELELLSAKQIPIPVEETVTYAAGPIKSDGGSSSYYDLPVPEWLLSELFDREIATNGKPYIKTEEIIAAFFGNDFDLGNVVKCLVRVKGLQDKTGGKAGNSVDYECNKMKYSVEKIRGKR